MASQIKIGEITASLTRKKIKNVHLSVHPPKGAVRIAAPERMGEELIRIFAATKLPWIKKQQQKILSQERETPREFIDKESHYVWGSRKLLQVIASDRALVEVRHNELRMEIDLSLSKKKRSQLLEDWYRDILFKKTGVLITKWESRIGVRVAQFQIRKMKTRWGSCTQNAKSIRINLELAKKPKECLEYLVVHEMLHILEPSHNARFVSLLDHHYPKWKQVRQLLNQLPVKHEEWKY